MTERSDGETGAAFHLSNKHHFLKTDFQGGKKNLDIAPACLKAISTPWRRLIVLPACTQKTAHAGMSGQAGNSISPDQGGINLKTNWIVVPGGQVRSR